VDGLKEDSVDLLCEISDEKLVAGLLDGIREVSVDWLVDALVDGLGDDLLCEVSMDWL